jgi:hypothetical protein
MSSSPNIGMRHVLALYPLLSMAAAYGLVTYIQERSARSVIVWSTIVVLLGAQLGALVSVYPRQLSYANALTASRADYYLDDSDFEWGQDVLAMEAYFRRHRVEQFYVVPNGTAMFCRHQLPPLKALPVDHHVTGWIAVFQRPYSINGGLMSKDICQPFSLDNIVTAPAGWLDWLHQRVPVAVIGSGVLLFHVSDAERM